MLAAEALWAGAPVAHVVAYRERQRLAAKASAARGALELRVRAARAGAPR